MTYESVVHHPIPHVPASDLALCASAHGARFIAKFWAYSAELMATRSPSDRVARTLATVLRDNRGGTWVVSRSGAGIEGLERDTTPATGPALVHLLDEERALGDVPSPAA